MLPSFLVIGAQKAGTSSLHTYLHRHPDVFMSGTKELDYFVAERNWSRGQRWYEAHFDGASGFAAAGESSPLYTMFPSYPDVPDRIAAVLPDVRLVYLVRDPIDRLRSHYLHIVAEGAERRPLDLVARDDSGLIAFSLYAMQIERYLEHFDRDQLLVLPAERLRDDRRAAMRSVLGFLGVDPDRLPDDLSVEAHRSSDKRVPRHGTGRMLSLARHLPAPVRDVVTTASTRPIDHVDTTIPPALERELVRQFRAEVPLLRDLIESSPGGQPFDGWGLA